MSVQRPVRRSVGQIQKEGTALSGIFFFDETNRVIREGIRSVVAPVGSAFRIFDVRIARTGLLLKA